MKIILLLTVLFIANTGCGVKGDPRPPATPAEIGKGRPAASGLSTDSAAPAEKVHPKTEVTDPDDTEDN